MKKQTFTMRLSDSLAQAVEAVKRRRKESSTSEVARRLLELGIDADRREADLNRSLLDDPRAALRMLRDQFYRNEPLKWEEWAFVTQRVHTAYLRAGRTFVTRSVLVDVLQATRALFVARTRHTGRADFAADGYHRSKLNLRNGESLVDGIARVADELRAWPDLDYAEWLSRPIAGFFNGDEPVMPDALIHEALAPFFETLLGLAVRSYWKETGESIADGESAFARPLAKVAVDGLSVQFMLTGPRVSALVDFGDIAPMLWTLASPPLIQDFFDVVAAANDLADDKRSLPEYGAGPRRISLPIAPYNKFILWDNEKNFHFERTEMERLSKLVAAARANPEVAAHERAARLAWGMI